MNTIIKNRLLSSLVVLLLVANMAAMGFFWWQRFKDNSIDFVSKEGLGASAFLIDKLKFDSSQLVSFKAIIQLHQQKIKWSKDSMHLAKDAFFELLSKDTVSEQELQTGASLSATKHAKLDRITFDFFKSVQSICTPEQKLIFKEVIKEALRIMGRPAPPPGLRPRPMDRPEGGREPILEETPTNEQPKRREVHQPQKAETKSEAIKDDRLNRTMKKLNQELSLDALQQEKVEEAYAIFFAAMDQIHAKALPELEEGPPPMPTEEEKIARKELAKIRDRKIENSLTDVQFKKYQELEKTMRPPQRPEAAPNNF